MLFVKSYGRLSQNRDRASVAVGDERPRLAGGSSLRWNPEERELRPFSVFSWLRRAADGMNCRRERALCAEVVLATVAQRKHGQAKSTQQRNSQNLAVHRFRKHFFQLSKESE